MNIPNKPKGMKDPVLIVGKWEERAASPPTAGHTKVVRKDLDDKEQKEALKDVPFRKASKTSKK